MSAQRYTFDRVVRLLIGIVILGGVLAITAYLSSVLLPFAAAFLIAYLLNPIVDFFHRRGIKSRNLAILLTFMLVIIVGAAATALLLPAIFEQGQHLIQLLQKLVADKELAKRAHEFLPENVWQTLREFLQRPEVTELLPTAINNPNDSATALGATNAMLAENPLTFWERARNFFMQPEIVSYLENEKFRTYLRGALDKVLPFTVSLFSGIVGFILSATGFLMMLLYLFFILRDYQRVSNGWQALIPPDHREAVVGFVGDFNLYMHRYFRAQTIIAIFSGIIMAIGFQIIGLPMGIMLGLFCGALSIVPYLQIVGFIPAAILALIYALDTGGSFWWIAVQIMAVFAVAQIIYDIVLVPRIMGEVTGLSPAIILLSLSVWWKFLGLLGFLIALPLTCLLLAYYRRLLEKRK